VNRSVSPPGWPCSATPVTGMPRGRGALGRWLPELIALDAAVAPPDPALVKTCHRDLNTENVLRAADGGIIVMDGETAVLPERELAAIICDLAADVTPQAARAGYAAYRRQEDQHG